MQPRNVGLPRGGLAQRGRGRPGLGFVARAKPSTIEQGGAKSNEQFRAMLLGRSKTNGDVNEEQIAKNDEIASAAPNNPDSDMKDRE